MTTTAPIHRHGAGRLPVSIEFELPDGWRSARPDSVGAPTAAFVAIHPESADGFTANITVAGRELAEGTSLTDLADESVARLGRTATVRVEHRATFGGRGAPGLTQTLHLVADINGTRRELVQTLMYLTLPDTNDPHRRALLEFALTTTERQLAAVRDGYQRFLRTLRPAGAVGEPSQLPPHQRMSAETLRVAASAEDAPPRLRALARAVGDGRTTWDRIAAGRAEDLPEVRDVHAARHDQTRRLLEEWGAATRPRPAPRRNPARANRDDTDDTDTGVLRHDPW